MVIHSKDLKIFKLSLFLSLYILIGSRFDSLRIWLIRPYRVICLEHITATLITTSLAKTFDESARVGVRDFGHNPVISLTQCHFAGDELGTLLSVGESSHRNAPVGHRAPEVGTANPKNIINHMLQFRLVITNLIK